jgi:hypothetical protein
MIVKVTQKHIAEGERNNYMACPVARALRETLGLDDGVGVSGEHIIIGNRSYNPPQSVRDFVDAFDRDYGVDPFEFELPKSSFNPVTGESLD